MGWSLVYEMFMFGGERRYVVMNLELGLRCLEEVLGLKLSVCKIQANIDNLRNIISLENTNNIREEIRMAEDTQVHVAVRSKDVRRLQQLVDEDGSINAPGFENLTPLMIAAGIMGDIQLTMFLLHLGALVETRGGVDNGTAAHLASSYGYVNTLNMVLRQSPAIVDIQDQHGQTPLHIASRFGQVQCVQTLLDAGSSINVVDNAGKTARDLVCADQGREDVRNQIDTLIVGTSQFLFPRNLQVQNIAQVSGSTRVIIRDFAITGKSLLGLKTVYYHEAYKETSQVVELDMSDAHEVQILHDKIPGRGLGLTVTKAGDLYVATTQVLLRVTPIFETIVIKKADYNHCRAAPGGDTVYAARVGGLNEPVCVDIVFENEIVQSVDTQIRWDGNRITFGVTGEENILFICSWGYDLVYKISLSDGQTLATYGQRGRKGAPGKLNHPRICCTNQHEILIADDLHHCLQVLNTRDEQWSVINVLAEKHQQLQNPRCAIMKGDTVIVEGGYYHRSLVGNDVERLWVLQKQN